MTDLEDDGLHTKEITLPQLEYERVMSNRDAARMFVHHLTEAAGRMASEREWSADDLIEVIRFALEGGPSRVDFLDGRLFYRKLDDTFDRAERYQENFSVMVVDLFNIQTNNSVYASVLDGLVERLRRSDMVFLFNRRIAIILPYTSGKDLSNLTHRIRELVEAVLGTEIELGIDQVAYPGDLGSRQEVKAWTIERLG